MRHFPMVKLPAIASLAVCALAFAVPAVADQTTGEALDHGAWVPNSTNALNFAMQVPGREGQVVPYVYFVSNGPGTVTLQFVNESNSLAFFEYRLDGAQAGTNPHQNLNFLAAGVEDTIHPGVCVDGRATPACGDGGPVDRTFNAALTVDVRLALGGERDWDFDWHRFYVVPVTTYSCVGFEPPADRDVFVKKPNRVLPLRMTLLDGDGSIVHDIASPVVSVDYSGSYTYAPGELDELNFVGRGDEGNMFAFDGSKWAFNLSTKGLAPGVYTITAVAGSSDYAIDPTCEVVVTIQ